jgi:hypothetical protein
MNRRLSFIAFRLSCIAALLAQGSAAFAALPTEFSALSERDNYVSAMPAPQAPAANVDWADGKDRTIYSIAVSSWNFDRYYDESRARYGSTPPLTEMATAKAGWLMYLLSLTGADKFTGNPPDHGWGWTITQPQIPLVNREVTPVNHQTGFRKPHLPPLRWSRDGRVGVVADIGGVDGKPQPLRIQAESAGSALGAHFLTASPGVPTMDPQVHWEVLTTGGGGCPAATSRSSRRSAKRHRSTPAQANPYACGSGGQDDCYDLTLIGSAVTKGFRHLGTGRRLPGGNTARNVPCRNWKARSTVCSAASDHRARGATENARCAHCVGRRRQRIQSLRPFARACCSNRLRRPTAAC